MKKILSIILSLLFVLSFSFAALAMNAGAADTVVYVSDGGTGDGSAAASPLGTLAAAYDKVAATGGIINIVGTVTVESNGKNANDVAVFTEPEHTAPITVTSSDKATLAFDSAKCNEFILSGETAFENIKISVSADAVEGAWFIARGNHITMGEGLEMPATPAGAAASKELGLRLVGIARIGDEYAGWETADSWITIKSGNFYYICGVTAYVVNAIYTGYSYIEFLGPCEFYECTAGTWGAAGQVDWQGTAVVSFEAKVINYQYFFTGVNYAAASGNGTCNMVLKKGGLFDTDGAPKKTVGLAKVLNVHVYYNAEDSDATAYAAGWVSASLTKDGAMKTVETLDKFGGGTTPDTFVKPAPVTTAAPFTGDTEVIAFAALALVALFGTVVITKKVRGK